MTTLGYAGSSRMLRDTDVLNLMVQAVITGMILHILLRWGHAQMRDGGYRVDHSQDLRTGCSKNVWD